MSTLYLATCYTILAAVWVAAVVGLFLLIRGTWDR